VLVPGRALLPAERFPDGIHPDDAGHALLAQALGPVLRMQLAGAGGPRG
jgi:lysophospholipase L1-like esterase